ncbi:MAG TPA: hypothetical protein VFS88_09885 [Micavibrio sp.]|nr:hypothetical protein [Micavibrio sp.]
MIILFGALSFALTQGLRSSSTTGVQERAKLTASEILTYVETLKTAVKSLRINGCADTSISFYSTSWSDPTSYDNPDSPAANADFSCHVFNPAGGATTFYNLPEGISGTSEYYITGGLAVTGLGTAVPELAVIAPDLSQEVCAEINKMLKVNSYAIDGYDAGFPFQGDYTAKAEVGDNGTNPTYVTGKTAACMESTAFGGVPAGQYFFYYVLQAR